MNRTRLKNYAPQARRDFIQAMMDRAAYYGLTAEKVEPVVEQGDVAVIGGREFPRAVARQRKALEKRIQRDGFEPTMEALAYTWFNRLVAIRYMTQAEAEAVKAFDAAIGQIEDVLRQRAERQPARNFIVSHVAQHHFLFLYSFRKN